MGGGGKGTRRMSSASMEKHGECFLLLAFDLGIAQILQYAPCFCRDNRLAYVL